MLNIKRNGNKKSSKIENSRASLLNHSERHTEGESEGGRERATQSERSPAKAQQTRQQISIQTRFPFYLPSPFLSHAKYTHQNIWMKSKQSSCRRSLPPPLLPRSTFTSLSLLPHDSHSCYKHLTSSLDAANPDTSNTICAIAVFFLPLSLPFSWWCLGIISVPPKTVWLTTLPSFPPSLLATRIRFGVSGPSICQLMLHFVRCCI